MNTDADETCMRRLAKVLFILHFFTLSTVFYAAFGAISVPVWWAYFFLSVLFILPLFIWKLGDVSTPTLATVCLIVPFVPLLIVIDPVESGLFGYDSYATVYLYRLFAGGTSIRLLMNQYYTWPAFHSFISAIHQVTGAPLLVVAKYIPLIMVSVPLMFFLAVRRLLNKDVAFLSALVIGTTNSLYLFDGKFVNEITAILLFFTTIFFLATNPKPIRQAIVLGPLLIVIALTHHVVSVVTAIFLLLWAAVPYVCVLGRSEWFDRIVPRGRRDISPLVALTMTFLIAVVYLLIAPEFTEHFVSRAKNAIIHGETTSPNTGVARDPENSHQVISRSVIGVLFLVVLINVSTFFSKRRLSTWEYTGLVFGGLIGFVYTFTLVVGRIVPLDPIRLFIFFAPIIFSVAIGFLLGKKVSGFFKTHWIGPSNFAIILIATFAITQVAFLPPHIMYSSPDEPTISEGHYTPAQHHASEWVAMYYQGEVVGWEPGLWVASGHANFTAFGHENFTRYSDIEEDCDGIFVWRFEAPDTGVSGKTSQTIYSAGNISLHQLYLLSPRWDTNRETNNIKYSDQLSKADHRVFSCTG